MGSDYGAAQVLDTAAKVAEWALRLAAGIALFSLAVKYAEEAEEDFEDATDALVAINERREEMGKQIHSHNLKVTFPFQKHAMTTALNIDVPSPDYGGLCSFYQTMSRRQLAGARAASKNYLAQFCISESESRRELDYFSGIASVDSSYARVRNQERREELVRNMKVDIVQGVHAGTFTGPQGVFGLIDDAAKVYGYIQQDSAAQFSGALAALGYGVGAASAIFGGGS